jgi:hypothetical protein
MNHTSPKLPTTIRDEQRGERGMHLYGLRIVLARMIWIALVVLILALFVASIPALTDDLHHGCVTAACHTLVPPYTVKQLQAAGVSISFGLFYTYVLTVSFSLIFLTLGAVIFWLKSNDFMALYSSFALVTFVTTFNTSTLLGLVPAWWLPIDMLSFLGSVLFGVFFCLFPTGRLAPRWTRWLVVGWVVYSGLDYFFPSSALAGSWPMTLFFFGLLLCVPVVQVYRYRRVSSQAERQQTKWVVFGASLAVVGLLLVTVLYWNNTFSLFQPNPRSDLIAVTATNGFLLLVPVSIAFAILRSRLWSIDIIINRTLVYGSLTVLLVGLYLGLILALQALVRAMTGSLSQSPLVIVASTLVIAALFQPLRRRLQNSIDRHASLRGS